MMRTRTYTALHPTYEHDAATAKGRHERAVHMFRHETGDLDSKRAFLLKKGMTQDEIQSAERAARRKPKPRKVPSHEEAHA